MVELSDDELARMTHAERAALLHRLAALETPPLRSVEAERRRHRLVLLTTVAVAGLVPWIVGLGLTLPHRYVIDRWSQTWIGFDAALVVCLAVTTWSGWRRRQLLIPAATVTATLLICDAWFDVMTARTGRDLAASLASAILVELPMATILIGAVAPAGAAHAAGRPAADRGRRAGPAPAAGAAVRGAAESTGPGSAAGAGLAAGSRPEPEETARAGEDAPVGQDRR